MSWAVHALCFSMFTQREMALAPCSQHPYLKATWLTVVHCGRTVIPVLAGSSHKEGKGLGGCHLHNGKSVQEGHQYCRRSFLLSLWWIRVTGIYNQNGATHCTSKNWVFFVLFCLTAKMFILYIHLFYFFLCTSSGWVFECGPAGNNDTLLII